MRYLFIYSMILLLPCFSFGDGGSQWITCNQALSQQTAEKCFSVNLSDTFSNQLQVKSNEIVVEFSTTSNYTFQCNIKNLIPGNKCSSDICEICQCC